MSDKTQKASVAWESPSNIALLKYWGKKGNQLPCNPSVSMTLKNAVTRMHLDYSPKQTDKNLSFEFEGKRNLKFEQRIERFLESISSEFPFVKEYQMNIRSENTFPHSTGIASSASAMSALALCLCSMQQQVTGICMDEEEFFQQASHLARLASGSAARSVYGSYAVWGRSNSFSKSRDEYAVSFSQYIHPVFNDYQDAILIVDSQQKKVSSTAGHKLMENHPYALARFAQANANFDRLLGILRGGDLEAFSELVENEALSLHGLMMNSTPSYTLLRPNTLEVIEKVRAFRMDSKIPLCFTLDAGPNVHLLFQKLDQKEVVRFVDSELIALLENETYLMDEKGEGPKQLN